MSVLALPRRSLAAACLAVLLLSSASVVGAVAIQDGAACASMAVPSQAPGPAGHSSGGHGCADPPPARVSGCANAPCCVLAPAGVESEATVVPAPPSSGLGDLAPASAGAPLAGAAPEVLGSGDEPRARSGRARLAWYSVLLI